MKPMLAIGAKAGRLKHMYADPKNEGVQEQA